MVYVISKNGQPLMPTKNHAKVRILLKNKKVRVIKRCPFTIQLAYDSTSYTQDITLGVDAGSKHIGISATTKDKVLFESDVELRNDIVDLLSVRRQNRRTRKQKLLWCPKVFGCFTIVDNQIIIFRCSHNLDRR